jgi:hypothetical protein
MGEFQVGQGDSLHEDREAVDHQPGSAAADASAEGFGVRKGIVAELIQGPADSAMAVCSHWSRLTE